MFYEIAEHLVRDLEIGDYTVLQRSDYTDVDRRFSYHFLCILADRADRFRAA